MRTAYLKAHYPNDFMAAVLSSSMGSTDRLIRYIASCNHSGIPVLPPDINSSQRRVHAHRRGRALRPGGRARRGRERPKAIIEEREANGPFTSLHDFVNRLDAKCYNRKTLEALMAGGRSTHDGLHAQAAHVLR